MTLHDEKGVRFPRPVVETVAKRAGNICSNPDCQAMTTDPAEAEDRSVTIGEAAHIFGANPGSARFDPAMSPAERSDITNAIWLCRNCHKVVDADAPRFSAALLFEWRRGHEKAVTERLGKPGDLIRQRLLSRELEEFKDCSYLAQQIVIDKPRFWEYKLTAELLRDKMGKVLSRWRALNKGLYAKPPARIPSDEIFEWISSKMSELTTFVGSLDGLINSEFAASWGPPGVPGSETEILRVCDLTVECSQRILEWEESVRFVSLPSAFEELKRNMFGIGGRQLENIAVFPTELAKIFEQSEPREGEHHIEIMVDLPDGWVEKIKQSMKAAGKKAFGVDM